MPKTSDYFEITETVEMGKLASLFFNKCEYFYFCCFPVNIFFSILLMFKFWF